MPRRKALPRGPVQLSLVDACAQKGETPSEWVLEARLDQVETLMAAGTSPTQIADHCRANYGIAERTARDYAAKVRDRWRREAAELRPERRRQIERMMEIAYQTAAERKETHAMIRAAVELARLHGLYRPGDAPDNREPDQHLHQHLHAHATVVQIDAVGMTPIERTTEIAVLEARRRAALAGRPKRQPAKARLEALLAKAKP